MAREKGIITMPDHKESFDKGIAKLAELGIDTVWENKIICSSRDPPCCDSSGPRV